MTQKISDFFEVFIFFFLTLWIYALFILTIPMGEDPHGWIALNGFDKPLWLGWVHWFIFGSALICALLGILMMRCIPTLTPEMVRNLWVPTYFFIWADTVLALTFEYQTINFLIGLFMGMFFVFLFFYLVRVLNYESKVEERVPDWKSQLIHYWTWGWMSFYFSLSFLLVYGAFKYSDQRWMLAFGALVVCFLNYIFDLFNHQANGRDIVKISGFARTFFIFWSFLLLASLLFVKI